MGFYINQDSKGKALPAKGKVDALLKDGAIIIQDIRGFQENLVCVVDNGYFEAAGYAFSPEEYREFSHPRDNRPKVWLVYKHAKNLSGYKE